MVEGVRNGWGLEIPVKNVKDYKYRKAYNGRWKDDIRDDPAGVEDRKAFRKTVLDRLAYEYLKEH